MDVGLIIVPDRHWYPSQVVFGINKFVRTKIRLKEGTKIELQREICQICQILSDLSDLQVLDLSYFSYLSISTI